MSRLGLGLLALAWACDSSAASEDHDSEVISIVEVTFTPDRGDPIVAAFTDPDGDGGVSGMADDIELTRDTDYTLSLRLLDDLDDPPIDVTEEVAREAEEHLVFYSGDGVRGPASNAPQALVTHAYADQESDYGPDATGEDLPVGLVNEVSATRSGTSEFRVVLRHLPELNGVPQKVEGLPESFARGDPLPGDVDVDVTFELHVD